MIFFIESFRDFVENVLNVLSSFGTDFDECIGVDFCHVCFTLLDRDFSDGLEIEFSANQKDECFLM